MAVTGFILQASYRISAGVPVLHLYGRLDNGESFLVRDFRQRPRFFIRAADAQAALNLGAPSSATPMRSFAGEALRQVEVGVPPDVPALRDSLHASGLVTFEADVRFAQTFLLDRQLRGSIAIEGHSAAAEGVDHCFDNPRLEPANCDIALRVLAFDIETHPAADKLLAISLYGLGADEVFIVDASGREMPQRAIACRTQGAAITRFCERVRELDPDVLTGWNVIDFDLTVLARVAARERVTFHLGRDSQELRLRPAEGYFGSSQATITGRLVLDGVDLLRGAFVRMDSYSLDAVAKEVLGEGKAVAGDVNDRLAEILDNYARDLPAFALYARTDSRLVLDILSELKLIPLAQARSRLTGMTPDRVSASIASFDFLYLMHLHQRRLAAPSLARPASRALPQAGGHVLDSVVGNHPRVWVFDFKSLYPSIIRTFNIDPLGFAQAMQDPQLASVQTSQGTRFARGPAILPGLLDDLFPQREAAKQRGDAVASQAIKILMNSFYGVLGTSACRFANPAIANAITGMGKRLLLWAQQWFEARGHQVLYGDTDSVFVASNASTDEAAVRQAERLAPQFNDDLASWLTQRWQVDSQLELEFEKLYSQLVLPAVRGGTTGARKRYVGLRNGSVEFVGMEVVRRDWTALARDTQRRLYEALFAGDPVDEYLRERIAQLRRGELDDHLIYHKGLRKPLDSYATGGPPHVVAARKMTSKPGRIISYVMTIAGPEPVESLQHEPDREHYIERQVRPIAEPVLLALNLDFDQVIGDDTQLGLF
ncbi:MAG: DNA polymerase II [Pseudomonadaceae bacterium]|nr:DNA polymerase II [Pseudomonadaceae bacterium]